MSQADESSRIDASAAGTPDPVSAMRAHIAHLESELAAAVDQLNAMESRATDFTRRATEAIEAADYARAREAIVEHHSNWEALDEEAGLLKADIRVLRVLLAECSDWLASSGSPAEHPLPWTSS